MIGFQLNLVEWNGQLVVEQVDEASTRFLHQVGFATMQMGRASIQPGREASAPGSPPRDKTGVLKRFIRYSVDAAGGLMIAGPQFLPRKSQHVPAALEHGGVSVTAQGDRLHIAARPFMGPALGKAIPRVLSRLADSIHS